MDLHAEKLPDGSDYYAILYGPVVLAAETAPLGGESLDFYADDSRMGHVPDGQVCPVDEVPVFVADSPDFARHIARIGDGELRFRIGPRAGLQGMDDAELVPFFRVHRSRYMLYWPYRTPGAETESNKRSEP